MASTSLKRANARKKSAVAQVRTIEVAQVAGAMAQIRKDRAKGIVLRALAKTGTLSSAARAARCTVTEISQWAEEDPGFAIRMVESQNILIDSLEEKATQMALSGNERLMVFMLKSLRREKFGDEVKIDATVRNVQVWKIGDKEISF